MKNVTIASVLMTLIMMASGAGAQTADPLESPTGGSSECTVNVIDHSSNSQVATESVARTQDREFATQMNPSDRIAASRSAYIQGDEESPDGVDHDTLAQFSARRSGRPFPRRGTYPTPTYPGTWATQGSGRHAAIGALIGFSLGAVVGARPGTEVQNRAAVSLLVGSVGALLGAMIGSGIPSFSARHWRPHPALMKMRWLPGASRPIPTRLLFLQTNEAPSKLDKGPEPLSLPPHLIMKTTLWPRLPTMTIPLPGRFRVMVYCLNSVP